MIRMKVIRVFVSPTIHSSDIEEETELKRFTQALQKAQITALKNININKRGTYSKQSKRTLRCCKQLHTKLASKGFLPVDKYIRLKAKQENQNKLILGLDNIINMATDKLEGGLKGGSDTNTPA